MGTPVFKSTKEVVSYRYISAWEISGSVSVAGDAIVSLLQSDKDEFVVTRDVHGFLEESYRNRAIAQLILNTWDRQGAWDGGAESIDSLAAEIKQIVKANTEATHLIAINKGEVDFDFTNSKSIGVFRYAFDAVNKTGIRERHRPSHESMKLAISTNEHNARFNRIYDHIQFFDAVATPVFGFDISFGRARLSVAQPLTKEVAAGITERYSKIISDVRLNSVKRLISLAEQNSEDLLRSYIFAWTALEVLIAKVFAQAEDEIMSPLLEGDHANLRRSFVQSVKEIMKGKYRLADRFVCVTAWIFNGAPEQETDNYLQRFKGLKKMRDNISHGVEFNENELPVEDLLNLLHIYLRALVLKD